MVKCLDCGYLAARNVRTRLLDETEWATRLTGETIRSIHEPPLCFMRNIFPLTEYISHNGEFDTESIRIALQKERECIQWIEWTMGFTPKEHREMMDRKFMAEMEEKRRGNDRKWHWIELAAIIVGTGFFTLLGAWIASPK